MNKVAVLHQLEILKDNFENGLIPVLHKHEVNPGLPIGSRENYLYFIMTCALNYQRDSATTWQSALNTWNDESTRFVFFPEKVVQAAKEHLRASLLKHKLALQPNRHIDIWCKISTTFNQFFNDDPRNLYAQCDYDAQKVIQLVQNEMKPHFPYLSGPKLSNYFNFILLIYTDLKLTNTKSLSIIPDTHIMKATLKLGLLDESSIDPISTEAVWRDLLENTRYSPIDFHSILWNWSRNNFRPEL